MTKEEAKKITKAVQTVQLFIYNIDCPKEFLDELDTLINFVKDEVKK